MPTYGTTGGPWVSTTAATVVNGASLECAAINNTLDRLGAPVIRVIVGYTGAGNTAAGIEVYRRISHDGVTYTDADIELMGTAMPPPNGAAKIREEDDDLPYCYVIIGITNKSGADITSVTIRTMVETYSAP